MDIEIPDWLGWSLLGALVLSLIIATTAGAFDGWAPTCIYGYEYIPELRTCIP